MAEPLIYSPFPSDSHEGRVKNGLYYHFNEKLEVPKAAAKAKIDTRTLKK